MKTIFVTGITGNQGGAVASSLLKNGFKVKALTRNPTSEKAQVLRSEHIELVKGNLDDPGSFQEHLLGVDGVYSVQTFDKGTIKEIRQGKALADLAKEMNISHFVYSSVSGADMHTGIPHFESKNEIESHIKTLDIPYTIIRPVSFMENFLLPAVKGRILKGHLSSPLNRNKILQMISVEDIGKVSADIFLNKENYLKKTITIAAEEMTMTQAAEIFSQVLEKPVAYQNMPMFLVRLILGSDLYKMFKWLNSHDSAFVKDIAAFRKEYPDLTGLREWVREHFAS